MLKISKFGELWGNSEVSRIILNFINYNPYLSFMKMKGLDTWV